MRTLLNWLPVFCVTLLAGCGLDGPIPSVPKRDVAAANTAPAANAAPAPNTVAEPSGGDKKTPEKAAVNAANPAKSAAGTKPDMVREKVTVASGEKGRGYGEGFITTPLKALWFAKQKLASDQVIHALQLFKASEGHLPKTDEEFMDKIINANHIQLPPLPPGSSYVYDPSKGEIGELMVAKPREP